jgi:exodeoxyribonuclease VII small subunit
MNAKMNEPRSYEEAFAELERLIAKMESPDLNLEEMLLSYQESTALICYLEDLLQKAEQEIHILNEKMGLEPFDHGRNNS